MTDIQLREVYYDANRGSHKSSRIPSIQRIDGGYFLNSHKLLHLQQKEAPVYPFVGPCHDGGRLRNLIPTKTPHSQKEDVPIHPYNDEMGASPRYAESPLPIRNGALLQRYNV